MTSPLLIADARPPLQLVIVQRESATASGENQHRGANQLIADVSCRAGIPRPDSAACGFGEESLRPSVIWCSYSMDSCRLRRSVAYLIAVPWSALWSNWSLVLIGQSMNPGPIPRELNDRSPRRAGSYHSGGEVGDRRGQTATLVNRPGLGAVTDK